MYVVLIQSWRAAVMGELDLQFELVLRDRTLAHRAGSPDPITAPHPIRCARGQLPILDSFSSLFAQQRFVRHLAGLRSHGAHENGWRGVHHGGEAGQIPEDTTAAPSTLTILWEALSGYHVSPCPLEGPGDGNHE